MRYPFLRTMGSRATRPLVPFRFQTLPRTRLLGLVDSGAHTVRIDATWAAPLGIDLTSLDSHTFTAAGQNYWAHPATVPLQIDRFVWDAEVTFVVDWGYSYQLLGIHGFFDRFIVKIDGQQETVGLSPSRRR